MTWDSKGALCDFCGDRFGREWEYLAAHVLRHHAWCGPWGDSSSVSASSWIVWPPSTAAVAPPAGGE